MATGRSLSSLFPVTSWVWAFCRRIPAAPEQRSIRVQCLPLSAQDHLFADDPRAQARLADAIEREVEFLRESSVRFSQQNPLGRLAAFLLTLSRENEQEGRDPTVLVQPLQCGVVADFLALSVERLGSLLVQLEQRGIIAPSLPQGLRLTDVEALEGLAGRTLSLPKQDFAIGKVASERRPAVKLLVLGSNGMTAPLSRLAVAFMTLSPLRRLRRVVLLAAGVCVRVFSLEL